MYRVVLYMGPLGQTDVREYSLGKTSHNNSFCYVTGRVACVYFTRAKKT